MKRTLSMTFVALIVLVSAPFGFAQRQTGSVYGRIMDTEKNPLPGAAVSIYGPSLMGAQNYLTSAAGIFHFLSLLPGEYEIRAEMPGFKTKILKGILVSVGKTTSVTIELEVASVEEEVAVFVKSSGLDVLSSKMSLTYPDPILTGIPLSRDLYDIQNSVPGAVSEGVSDRRSSSILGGTVRGQLYAVDGGLMNDPATFYPIANINFDVYEEIEFEVGAHPADVSQSDSTYVNIVTKSGGNTFSGQGLFYFTGKSLTENLFTPEQMSVLNVNPPASFTDAKDFSLNLGGPFWADRAWFFLDGRRLTWDEAYSGAPELRMAPLGFTTSPHYDFSHREWLAFAKLTLQPTKNIHYTGTFNYGHIYEPVYQYSVGTNISFENTNIWDHENSYATTHQVDLIVDQNTYVNLRGTYVYRSFPLHSQTQGSYTSYDAKQDIFWGSSPYNMDTKRNRLMASASITRFQEDLLGANHEVKAGGEFEQSESHQDWYRSNPYATYWNDYAKRDPYFIDPNNSIGRLIAWPCPAQAGIWDIQDNVRRFSAYVQDSAVAGRLTLNAGLRFDYSYQYEPDQYRPQLQYSVGPELLNPEITDPNALLNALSDELHGDGKTSPFDALATSFKKPVEFLTFSPRFGLAYDVFGDGRTALKLSFARYYEPIWTAKYSAGQIFSPSMVQWDWYDLDQNGLMDLPDVDKYVLTSYPEQNPDYSFYEFVDQNGQKSSLKAPYTTEIRAGLEHEAIPNVKFGLDFVWRKSERMVEDIDIVNGYNPSASDSVGLIWLPLTFTDPGWDAKFGTGDDQILTIYGLRADRPAPIMKGTNPPEARREYWAVIFTFDKRMANKWQLKGSVVYSSEKGNVGTDDIATLGQTDMFNNPNTLINTDGPLAFDRPLQIKLMGTCILPFDFVLSAYFQFYSGSPWQRTLARVYFPANYLGYGTRAAYYSVNAEPAGTQRNPSLANLDLRLEKSFKLGNSAKFSAYADIFNVSGVSGINVNLDPAGILRSDKTPATYALSTTYGRATSIYGVRSFRLGARFSF
jgi:hypothetical protein